MCFVYWLLLCWFVRGLLILCVVDGWEKVLLRNLIYVHAFVIAIDVVEFEGVRGHSIFWKISMCNENFKENDSFIYLHIRVSIWVAWYWWVSWIFLTYKIRNLISCWVYIQATNNDQKGWSSFFIYLFLYIYKKNLLWMTRHNLIDVHMTFNAFRQKSRQKLIAKTYLLFLYTTSIRNLLDVIIETQFAFVSKNYKTCVVVFSTVYIWFLYLSQKLEIKSKLLKKLHNITNMSVIAIKTQSHHQIPNNITSISVINLWVFKIKEKLHLSLNYHNSIKIS